MGSEGKYDRAEFGFATRGREDEVKVTFVLNRTDWDYLQVLIRNRAFGYRATDDVIRESIHRHINLLSKSRKAKRGFSTPDILDAVTEARRQIKERDLCIVLEIIRGLALHSLSGKSHLIHLLACILKHKVQRVQSKHLRETYLDVIDEIMSLADESGSSRVPQIASLNPSTFEDGSDAEE
jgi:hypothetical protein